MVNLSPRLHTLVVDYVPESALLEIAARGASALRILDNWTMYTYRGLQQITAALPQLTGLSINFLDLGNASTCIDLLAGCQQLETLRIGTHGISCETVNAVLESAAAHCPNLQNLIISGITPLRNCNLSGVLENCPLLRTIDADACAGLALPSERADALFTHEYTAELAEWLPGWEDYT